jgi:hypothetical protein
MVDCPKLREARRQMRSKVGEAFNSVAVMLGGKPGGDPAKAKNWSIDRDMLNAVLDFAEASKRFQSRAPEGSQHPSRRQGTQWYRGTIVSKDSFSSGSLHIPKRERSV